MSSDEEDARYLGKRKRDDHVDFAHRSEEVAQRTVRFIEELSKTGFTLIQPEADFGFFEWKPEGPEKDVLSIKSAAEVECYVDPDAVPRALVDPSSESLISTEFRQDLPSCTHGALFPYGMQSISCLLVAKDRSVPLDEIDFCFGGSVLEFLASQTADTALQSNIGVVKVPGLNLLMVRSCRSYSRDFADLGYQFERVMTAKDIADTSSNTDTMHLHTMKIGTFRVLFQAEVDALYKGDPVELAASNPAYWGTRKLFQCISSGSLRFCHGVKQYGKLLQVQMYSLAELAASNEVKAILPNMDSFEAAEDRIIGRMEEIRKLMDGKTEGEVFEVVSSKAGAAQGPLLLKPSKSRLLPMPNIVKELLRSSAPLSSSEGESEQKESNTHRS